MDIKLNENHRATIAEIANEYGVDSEKLEGLYYEIMYNNFYDDVADIARENREYLNAED